MNKWVALFGLLFLTVFFVESAYCQNQILGKIKVKGPEENPYVIGEPKQVLLRIKSTIRNLEFESSMSKELPVHKQGESTYNVYVPPGRQYITIMAEGFQNVEITYNFKVNRSYLIELEPEEVPIPIQSTTTDRVETSPTDISVDNNWGTHRNIAFGGALVFGITTALLKSSANDSYDSYQSATTEEDAQKYREDTEQKDTYAAISAGISVAFLAYAIYSWIRQGSYTPNEQALSVGFAGNAFAIRIRF